MERRAGLLVPKRQLCETITDWRPITLMLVVYKLVTKMIANRLKANMDSYQEDKLRIILQMSILLWSMQNTLSKMF